MFSRYRLIFGYGTWLVAVSLFATTSNAAPAADAAIHPLSEVIQGAIATSAKQYEWMLTHLPHEARMPRTFEHGKLVTVIERDWTVGFFPGSLWYLFMSSALFELADLTRDAAAAARYVDVAEAQVRSLCSPEYLAEPGTNGGFLLKHATGNHPKNSEIDTPRNYADYYFLEARLRARISH